MFTLCASSAVGGDETRSYSIYLEKKYTVYEFIQEILENRSNEWGCIIIRESKSKSEVSACRYNYGKLKTSLPPSDILTKNIVIVNASGGWTRMDYVIQI